MNQKPIHKDSRLYYWLVVAACLGALVVIGLKPAIVASRESEAGSPELQEGSEIAKSDVGGNPPVALAVDVETSGQRTNVASQPQVPARVVEHGSGMRSAVSSSAAAQPLVELQPTGNASLQPETRAEVFSYSPLIQTNRAANYAAALERLAKSKSDIERYHALGEVAKLAFVFGQTEEARKYAAEQLALDQAFEREIWRAGGGQAIHDANMVLGRVAAQEGRIDDAKQFLLEAGQSPGSPVLGSFGPNMGLAKDLLQHGERETVLQYFELCKKFWAIGGASLSQWTDEVKAGKLPDFGANLLY